MIEQQYGILNVDISIVFKVHITGVLYRIKLRDHRIAEEIYCIVYIHVLIAINITLNIGINIDTSVLKLGFYSLAAELDKWCSRNLCYSVCCTLTLNSSVHISPSKVRGSVNPMRIYSRSLSKVAVSIGISSIAS